MLEDLARDYRAHRHPALLHVPDGIQHRLTRFWAASSLIPSAAPTAQKSCWRRKRSTSASRWANGDLAVKLMDQTTPSLTYSANLNLGGALSAVLDGTDLAYIGLSGADGNSALLKSVQTVSNFTFTPTIPPVRLAISSVTSSAFILSWPVYPANFVLEEATALKGPWTLVPTVPTVAGGVNMVTRNYTGGPEIFYKLERVVCGP